MATAHLIVEKGARPVTHTELEKIEPPPATESWKPTKHSDILTTVCDGMEAAGFHVTNVQAVIARGDHRLFATVDTATNLNGGSVTLAAAIINSTDRSLPMKFVAGNRVLVCCNLALRSDLMAPVRKKHTKNGLESFVAALARAITSLDHFAQVERVRIKRFHDMLITDMEAESIMLRAYEKGIVSHRLMDELIGSWRHPQFPEFEPRTLWSLENCFTGVLTAVQKSNPQRFCVQSLSLQSLLSEVAGPTVSL